MDFEMNEINPTTPVKKESAGVSPQMPTSDSGPMLNQENIGRMIKIAGDIVEIQKSREQHAFEIERMEQFRKALLDEAEAYATKKRADTNSTISRMEQLRSALNDFYQANHQGLTSEDYRLAIAEITRAFSQLSF